MLIRCFFKCSQHGATVLCLGRTMTGTRPLLSLMLWAVFLYEHHRSHGTGAPRPLRGAVLRLGIHFDFLLFYTPRAGFKAPDDALKSTRVMMQKRTSHSCQRGCPSGSREPFFSPIYLSSILHPLYISDFFRLVFSAWKRMKTRLTTANPWFSRFTRFVLNVP